jgi:hypothetical protein
MVRSGLLRGLAFLMIAPAFVGCREVRVKDFKAGTTVVPGRNQVVILSDPHDVQLLGIHAPEVNFKHEFGVALLMGPHRETGWRQVIESIRANEQRVRIVAYENQRVDGGEPTAEYRTYTLWIVPRLVYRAGSLVEVVTPSGDIVAGTRLR